MYYLDDDSQPVLDTTRIKIYAKISPLFHSSKGKNKSVIPRTHLILNKRKKERGKIYIYIYTYFPRATLIKSRYNHAK